MSYNVTATKITRGKIIPIDRKGFNALTKISSDELAEGNLIDGFPETFAGPIDVNDVGLWYGEFSGSSFDDTFLARIMPHLKGEFTLRVVWEGGDSIESLKFKDGKMLNRKSI